MKHSKINGMLLQRFTVKPCLVKYFKWLLKVIKSLVLDQTTKGTSENVVVSCPDPTHEGRGSGYTRPISWASGSAEAL